MNKFTIGLIVVVLAALGAYVYTTSGTSTTSTGDESMMEDDSMKTDDSMKMEDGSMEMTDGMSMEEHVKAMDDGKTVMAMAGALSPATLYVSPGQELTLANHESVSLKLVASDGSFESTMVEAGKNGTFKAPTKPGRYEYSSSANPEVKGILVVEE